MSRSMTELAAAFDASEQRRNGRPLPSSCCVGFGGVFSSDRASRFGEFVRANDCIDYYSEAKSVADRDCPKCRGEGVIPYFVPGNPYMSRCVCAYRPPGAAVERPTEEVRT